LALAAGQLSGLDKGVFDQPDTREHFLGTSPHGFGRRSVPPSIEDGRQLDILDNQQVIQKMVGLEYKAHIRVAKITQLGVPKFTEHAARHYNLAIIPRIESADDVEERRLSGAGTSDDRNKLTLPDLHVNSAKNPTIGGVGLADPIQTNHALGYTPLPMKALALDFDGVICNSARETYLVGASTYAEFYPSSPLVQRLGDPPNPPRTAATPTPDFAAFVDLLPLGNRAEDFGVAFRAIDLGIRLADQEAYDAFYSSLNEEWRNQYHHRFYRRRAVLRDGDRDAWLRLHATYPRFIDVLRRRSADVHIAVASAKDAVSVRLLLEAFGIADLFGSDSILDKETGVHKTDHMRLLQARLGIGFNEITFVDDKVNHLVRVGELGVRPVLAGWGFNTEREHRMAERMEIRVAGLGTFEHDVFGGE